MFITMAEAKSLASKFSMVDVNPWKHVLSRQVFHTRKPVTHAIKAPQNVCRCIAHLLNMQLDFIASGPNLFLYLLFSILMCQGKSMGNVKQAWMQRYNRRAMTQVACTAKHAEWGCSNTAKGPKFD